MTATHVAKVKRRGASILALCREIEAHPTVQTFVLVECGLHSGFPPCCIRFFAKTYWPQCEIVCEMHPYGESSSQLLVRATSIQKKALIERDRYMEKLGRVDPLHRVGYIPCSKCLREQSFVKVKRCDWHLTARERSSLLRDV